jgi:DNA-binding transcriptional MerR regulator
VQPVDEDAARDVVRSAGSERLTIEQLAARAGMTVRNVREHQTRGLLPPPALVGRKGFYDARHLSRLQLVRQLQQQGLNLHAIAWLLEHAPADAPDEVARLEQALFAPWTTERARVYSLDELRARFGDEDGTVARSRAEAMGLLRALDGERWEAPAPRLLEAGAQLVELGVEVDAALTVVERLLASASAVATSFLELFVTEILYPRDPAEPGRGARDEAEGDRGAATVRDAVERLRPVASEAVLAAFQLRMDELVSRTIGAGGDGPRRGRP